jgi:hypothetical protein
MKPAFLLGVCLCSVATHGADFVNLGFDDPDLSRLTTNPTGGIVGPVEDLFRGWEVSLRPVLSDWQPYAGEVQLTFQGGQTPVSLASGYSHDGTGYGVWFNSQQVIGNPPSPDIRLSTAGTVPEGALTFDWVLFRGVVSIDDGQTLKTIGGSANSLDVSLFAGKDVTLSFFVNSGGFSILDVIGFTQVPEPQTWALLGVGLSAVLWWSRRR